MTSLSELPELLDVLRARLNLRHIHLVLAQEKYADYLPDSIAVQPQASLERILRELCMDYSTKQPLMGAFQEIRFQTPGIKVLLPAENSPAFMGSLCVFSLWNKYQPGELIGFLTLIDQNPQRYSNKMATDYIEFFADLFAWSLVTLRDHEKLIRENTTDYLTGCHNRNYLLKHAPRILDFAQRKGFPVALLFIDLDGFKQVNDTLGHDCGDRILISVAQCIQNIIRDYDIFIRHGGDEFLLLLPDVEQNIALRTASRIRKAIQNVRVSKICSATTDITISASIGVAMHLPGEKLITLIQRADHKMYASKRASQDQCFCEES
ncbi:GGDEF domain-containing protein [Desulfonatronum thiosulfatophilum]|nr:GGDEF domain-containing protein [Desulfonatronum thiosulfatophilum]